MSDINQVLEERGSRYGRFADHARIAQGLQDTMRAATNWDKLDQDMKQALSVIADKIARILNGDPFYADNWHDVQGYAKLIEDRINMIEDDEQELFEPEVRIEVGELSENDKLALEKYIDRMRGPTVSYYQQPSEIRPASGGYVKPGQTYMIGAGFNGA